MAINVLRSILGKTPTDQRPAHRVALTGPRIPRHSSGWLAILKHLREEQSLRILDVGPTSPSNINFLTGLGHSIYMADIVGEANHGEWFNPANEDGLPTAAEVENFFAQNMDFGGRVFDVVLLWTTLDYLPEALLEPTIARLHASVSPNGRILAFFHTKTAGQDAIFYRHHVTDGDSVEMQEAGRLPVRQVLTNRKIEKIFSAYQGFKFYLAKDNLSEVIMSR